MTNVIICGCNGKMGHTLTKMILKRRDYKIVAGVDVELRPYYDIPIFKSFDEISLMCDVIIDFSSPKALTDILQYAVKNKVAAVLCTTGYSKDQIGEIKKASDSVPIFLSRNMSIGVSIIIELARQVTKILGSDFDIEIIEKHHNQKLDAPSGTALMMADAISKYMDKDVEYVYNRHNDNKKRSKNEIGIHSIRGGNIIGEHEIIFAGEDEILSLKHTSGSRNLFAYGALKCSEFIKNKSPGMYNMEDMMSDLNKS